MRPGTEKDRLGDDVFWMETVERLGLAPNLDELECEARSAARPPSTPSERLEAWLALRPAPARFALIGAFVAVLALVAAVLLVAVQRVLLALGSGLPALLGGDRPLEFHASAAHVVALSILLVVLATQRRLRAPEGLVARRAWRQFRRGWAVLWVDWLVLYVWLTAYFGLGHETGLLAEWGRSVADVLNVSSAAVFLYLFLVLDRPSVKAEGQPQRDRAFRRSLAAVVAIAGATALLAVLGRRGQFGLEVFGPACASILVAMSMAFFVGRLSDSHLPVRRAFLAPLYFYVPLQMLWHPFVMAAGKDDVPNALILFGALVLKVYLFALIGRWMQDARLQTYFDEVAFPRLASDLESG